MDDQLQEKSKSEILSYAMDAPKIVPFEGITPAFCLEIWRIISEINARACL